MKLKTIMSIFFLAAALCCTAAEKKAFKFHQLFTDHAVFQQNTEQHPFRGYAPAGSVVEVQFRDGKATVTADQNGQWCAFLPTGSAGTGFELKATCNGKTLLAKDIAVGEVWFVSGQSNAEFPLKKFKDGALWAKEDSNYPQIRFQRQTWQPPHMRKDDTWQVLDEKSAMNFSATGFFFAKELHKTHKVPVGIIVSAVGGSVINKWVPEDVLATIPHAKSRLIEPLQKARATYPEKLKKYEAEQAERKAMNPEEAKKLPALRRPNPPMRLYSNLFDQLVGRLAGHPVKGTIWYQGEADAMFAGGYIYREYLKALILSYRKHFKNNALPFLVVEIPYYGNHMIWSDLRDSQKYICDSMNGVYLTSILDLGDEKDIHPPRKAELGERLMLTAEKFVYGKNIVATGPVYESMSINGDKIVLRFNAASIGGGLCAKDNAPLRGFVITGKNGKAADATAVIEGDTVVVSAESIKDPVSVRYGWYPPKGGVNFYNKAGLPCGQFRTDDFRLPTEPRKSK